MKQITGRYVEAGTPEETDRLVTLLATALERFLVQERPEETPGLDLSGDLSVHTDNHHATTGPPSE